jgi:hypothetical protein
VTQGKSAYSGFSPQRLIVHARDLLRRMHKAGVPLDGAAPNKEVLDARAALSAVAPKTAQYREAQRLLIALGGELPPSETAAAPVATTAPGVEPVKSYIEQLRDAAGPTLTQGITPRQYEAAAAMIRLNGYDCPQAELLVRFVFSEGYSVYCRGGRYEFQLQNHGGQWSVTPP